LGNDRGWPALDVRAAATSHPSFASAEERLLLLLDDLDPIGLESDCESWHWRVYFVDSASRDTAVAPLRALVGEGGQVVPLEVEDEGWVLRVQEDLRAVRVGAVVVAPPWDFPHETSRGLPGAPSIVIVIEPSMGFGTGHHQSTRLCLRALQAIDVRGAQVIDVGTGSGVLALAACRLGALHVVAIDNDPDSVTAAQSNAVRNGVTSVMDVTLADVDDFDAAPAEIVVANLTAWLLRRYQRSIAALIGPGGRLATSGFTVDQVSMVTEAFPDFDLERRDEEEEWVALTLRRR
jgi:ribosomal protein L11 methyltransferase